MHAWMQLQRTHQFIDLIFISNASRRTHNHSTATTLSGATYARQVEVINGYTVEFQSTGTPYQVTCVGANHNIGDVKVVNDVSLVIGNSAGLIQVTNGSGVTAQDKLDIADRVWEYTRP